MLISKEETLLEVRHEEWDEILKSGMEFLLLFLVLVYVGMKLQNRI